MVCMDAYFCSCLAIRFRIVDEEGFFGKEIGIFQHLFKNRLVGLGQVHLEGQESLFEIVVYPETVVSAEMDVFGSDEYPDM